MDDINTPYEMELYVAEDAIIADIDIKYLLTTHGLKIWVFI